MLRQITTLEEVIPSKDMREFIVNNEIEFTDFECFSIINHSALLTFERRHQLMEQLISLTSNKELIKQIFERIDYEKKQMVQFYNNKNACYMVSTYSEEFKDYLEEGLCRTIEGAFELGSKLGKDFQIEKWKLLEYDEIKDNETNDCYTCTIAGLYCNQNLEKISFWSKELNKKEMEDWSVDRYDNSYIDIPDPFHTGDIVKDCCSNTLEYGIVADNYAERKIFFDSKPNLNTDYYDFSHKVYFYTKNKKFSHDHMSPFYLEKVKPEELAEEYDLLKTGSQLLCGEGSLEYFLMQYDARKNE